MPLVNPDSNPLNRQKFLPLLVTLFVMARSPSRSREQGLTLLECLVAMMVIAVTIAAITPPIFVAVATRVQNQRAEQAQQLAQQEIDRIRLLVERGNYTVADLPPSVGTASITGVSGPTTAPAKNTNLNNRSVIGTNPQASYLADVNGDGVEDFLVQVYRDDGVNAVGGTPPPVAFRLGVRVYSAQARPRLGSLLTDTSALKFVSGQGQQITRPLAVLYTQLARSDSNTSLGRQCLFLGGAANQCPSP